MVEYKFIGNEELDEFVKECADDIISLDCYDAAQFKETAKTNKYIYMRYSGDFENFVKEAQYFSLFTKAHDNVLVKVCLDNAHTMSDAVVIAYDIKCEQLLMGVDYNSKANAVIVIMPDNSEAV